MREAQERTVKGPYSGQWVKGEKQSTGKRIIMEMGRSQSNKGWLALWVAGKTIPKDFKDSFIHSRGQTYKKK